ncbi:MAG: alpha/beta fold hydrolase [Clostridia bacterium]|nr:alpha/beta fold hydrolase [Clostridia bacterium]
MLIYDDGIKLSAVLEVPEGHDGHRLVILLHGFTSAKDRPHNVRAANAMREAGFATLRFDLYGHGESGGEFRNHTLFKWISNTMAVIRWALEHGYDDLYLSGHSQGGLVAALVAGMEADRIHGLILRAPAFTIPQGARDGTMIGGSFDPDHIPDEVDVIKGLKLSGDYLRVAQTIHPEDAVRRYRGPVLILHGEDDDTIPLEDSVKFSADYACCDLVMIPGETHHFYHRPDQMEKIIREWLDDLQIPGSVR